MVDTTRQRLKYIIGDYISSNVAWMLYNCIRYLFKDNIALEGFTTLSAYLKSDMVVLGQIIFPILMISVYLLSGYYNTVFRKSSVQELLSTLSTTLINTLIIFFIALINDMVYGERYYNYELFLFLWGALFIIVYPVRLIITNITNNRIHNRKLEFNTIIVGASERAIEFEQQLRTMTKSLGYKVLGYIEIPGEKDVDCNLRKYKLSEIGKVCFQYDIKELIVVPTTKDTNLILKAINKLYILNLPIKISIDFFNILLGKMKLSNMYGEPLIDISCSSMNAYEKNIKRLLDVIISGLSLIFLSPVLLVVSILIKLDSKGPVLFRQERVGYRNKSFSIIKFRSMVCDAESDGIPRLATDGDVRITKIGRFLRKYRIDELPQFYNVLIGEMSLVGPRPEREYYVNKIIKIAPFYSLVHQVRPGLTSMGMVKFGYAKSVDEMVERLKYDLIYLENMSISTDIKILIYTIKTVLTGRGL